MKAEKIRNLTDDELKHQERDLADQLFKLKFQMNMGQTESLKKIRGLRRDIARVKTVLREQELSAGKAGNGKTESSKATPSGTAAKAVKTATKTKISRAKHSTAKHSTAKVSKAEKR
jgi:large subunit ribosomal protein L29